MEFLSFTLRNQFLGAINHCFGNKSQTDPSPCTLTIQQEVETKPILIMDKSHMQLGIRASSFQWREQWKNRHCFWHLQKSPNLFYGKLLKILIGKYL